MNVDRLNYDELGHPVGPYVHATKHNNTLYLSGLTAFGSKAQSGDIEAQAREIFRQIELIAMRENSGLDQIIRVTIYVTDLSKIVELRDQLLQIYGAQLPASSLVTVPTLFSPDIKIEITATLALPNDPAQ